MSRATGDVLVLGGYGSVGRVICQELAEVRPGRVIAAGRSRSAADSFARESRGRIRPGTLNLASADLFQALPDGAALVVNCVERRNAELARACFERGIHLIDISATPDIIRQLEALDELAAQRGATGLLSVGTAPGLTNLLAREVRDHLGALSSLNLSILIGLGEAHGPGAVRWMLDSTGRAFTRGEGNEPAKQLSGQGWLSGRGWRMVPFPAPIGSRRSLRFGFSDQVTVCRTLGAESASTWLCLDEGLTGRLATRLLNLLAWSPVHHWRGGRWISDLLVRGGRHGLFGSDRFAVQAEATNHAGETMRATLIGRGEARATGVIAAETALALLNASGAPGVFHLEERFSLETFAQRFERESIEYLCESSHAKSIGSDR